MITYLLLSIVSATLLLIILKKFVFWQVNTLHGIIVNYWVAASFSFAMAPQSVPEVITALDGIWPVSLTIGFMFITVFLIIAKTTQVAGIAVASVASKMSMVIPIVAGILLYHESTGLLKSIGILLAVPAVIITSRPSVPAGARVKFNIRDIGLPVLLFLGAGLVDTAIKFAQHHYMNDQNRQIVIMSVFGFAGLFGLLRLLFDLLVVRKPFMLKSIAAGILLGVTNYYSLYFLLRCLEQPGSESSTVFAFVNTGVVLASFLTGLWLFGEKANKNKIAGIAMAILSIVILAYH